MSSPSRLYARLTRSHHLDPCSSGERPDGFELRWRANGSWVAFLLAWGLLFGWFAILLPYDDDPAFKAVFAIAAAIPILYAIAIWRIEGRLLVNDAGQVTVTWEGLGKPQVLVSYPEQVRALRLAIRYARYAGRSWEEYACELAFRSGPAVRLFNYSPWQEADVASLKQLQAYLARTPIALEGDPATVVE